MAIRDEIEEQFQANLGRVRELVDLSEAMNRSRARKPKPSSDLLRAAVVLLHATLEDLLRSLAEWKLPTALATSVERIPLGGTDRGQERFTRVDLAGYRGRSVDSVIAQSIAGYLERSSYNHPGDIGELLGKISVDLSIEKDVRDDLAIRSRAMVINVSA
jgi:hypothetical protein